MTPTNGSSIREQSVEQITFHNRRGLRLSGHFWPGDDRRAVLFVHGFTSDKSWNGKFDWLAEQCQAAGYSCLAFDFAGRGASAEDHLCQAKQLDDLYSAVNWLAQRGYRQVLLWGHSLGAVICLKLMHYAKQEQCAPLPASIEAMVLTGAGTGPVFYDWPAYYNDNQMAALADKGHFEAATPSTFRDSIVITRQILDDFSDFPPAVLESVDCPALLIHGGDDEELMLYCLSQTAMEMLPAGSLLKQFPAANHSFDGHLDALLSLGLNWLATHLPLEASEPTR